MDSYFPGTADIDFDDFDIDLVNKIRKEEKLNMGKSMEKKRNMKGIKVRKPGKKDVKFLS